MKKTLFLLFLIIILSSGNTAGIGLSNAPIEPNPRLFEPGLTFSVSFTITKYRFDTAEAFVEGDLAEYVTIKNLVEHDNYITFTAEISLPEEIETPGLHYIYIGAREVAPPDAGGIIALTIARVSIKILVLYDEKIAEFSRFSTPNVNENEKTTFSFDVESVSKQEMTGIWANIKIYNFNNDLIRTMKTETFSLESTETKTIKTEFDSTGLVSGQYFAEAEIHWENQITTLDSKFNIGTLNVEILNFSRNFTAGQINKLNIEIESKWNGNIKNVFAQLFVDGEEQTATQSYNLGSFETKDILGFLDLTYFEEGKHDLKIILNYGDETTNLEEEIDITGKGKKRPISLTFNTIEIMMFLVIIVLILIIVIIVLQNKKKK